MEDELAHPMSKDVSRGLTQLLVEAVALRDRLRLSERDLDELLRNLRDEAWQEGVQDALMRCADVEHCRREEAEQWRRINEELEHLGKLVPMPGERNPS